VYWFDAATIGRQEPARAELLPRGELAALERIRDLEHAATVAGTRMVARITLGRELGVEPAKVHIERTCAWCGDACHGKPRVPGDALSFSVSHAATFGVVALSRDVCVGADVELPSSRFDDLIANEALAASEMAEYMTLSGIPRRTFLVDRWVAKEAVLKALGVGLAIDPVSLAFGPPAPSGWKTAQFPSGALGEWHVAPTIDIEQFRIAIAADHEADVHIKGWAELA